MRLSGGGARHNLDEITPRLIKRRINDDNASEIPVVTSCRGVPFVGRIINNSTREQQFIIAKNDSMMNPRRKLINFV